MGHVAPAPLLPESWVSAKLCKGVWSFVLQQANPRFPKSLLINQNTPVPKSLNSDRRGSWTTSLQFQELNFYTFVDMFLYVYILLFFMRG